MQSLEFVEALKKIVRELRVVELTNLLRPWVKTPNTNVPFDDALKNQFVALVFDSHSGYERLLLDAETRPILEQMEVSRFYEAGRLRQMINSVASVVQLSQLVQQHQLVFGLINSFAEQLDSFLGVQRTAENLLEKEKIGVVNPDESITELELVEYADEEGFSPRRIQVLSESIAELHSALVILFASESQTITFKYFDSGSGLLVGILCAKGIADVISTLFSQWWDKIVFFRYDSFDKKIEAANKSLSFAKNVEDSISAEIITRETGENLKRRVFQELDKLTGIGVTTPITATATIDQKQLLTEMRNTKLLTGGTSSTEAQAGPSVQV